MMDIGATSMLSSVVTREMEDLNTSDHVPLVASLLGGTKAADVATEDYTRKVSWDSIDEVCENAYVAEVKNLLQPFLGYCHSDVKELGSEIESVSQALVDRAFRTLTLVNG
jgi:hypothetical protein